MKEEWIRLHFFMTDCDWYISEFDGKDTFWGYAIIQGDYMNSEWGYVSFSELKSIAANGWLEIDCELEEHWKIRKAGEIEKICLGNDWSFVHSPSHAHQRMRRNNGHRVNT
jgi:hypothetical protein